MIFAFGGNVLIATSFYVVQRTCRARLAGDLAPWFVVLGYNFFIVIAGTGYLLGIMKRALAYFTKLYIIAIYAMASPSVPSR